MSKPSIPKGNRDFGPLEISRRNYIFDTIRSAFQKLGYQPIETPSMENLSTLTGKYGEEGDQLIFKVLNSGDFLRDADAQVLESRDSKKLSSQISEKALRYDLTVPFARYVVMHQNEISFPFKRYQIQPVWRADRPQRGRYREFYQCDADVVGSDSLLHEAEFIAAYDEVLSRLGLEDFSIYINNRKILAGMAELLGKPDAIIPLTVAIDKIDKIGLDAVIKELQQNGFTETELVKLRPLLELSGSNLDKIAVLEQSFQNYPVALYGLEEVKKVLHYLEHFNIQHAKVELSLSLARGLNYYTGTILEVKTHEVSMGSIGGGGRYDDLTSMFGLKGISGVGISFGADRIYDVLAELNLFPATLTGNSKVLITCFEESHFSYGLNILKELRGKNIASEIYPTVVKMQKQMKYANDKGIPFVIIVGEDEVVKKNVCLKNMENGQQEFLSLSETIQKLSLS